MKIKLKSKKQDVNKLYELKENLRKIIIGGIKGVKQVLPIKRKEKYAGYYFSDKYSRDAYPRSETARSVSTPDEFQVVASYSADSDICRAIIDLDRYLYLVEKGYKVEYQGELFVAERRA